MPIEEFISKLTLPLSDLSDVEKVINCYSEHTGSNDFYARLVHVNYNSSGNSGSICIPEKNRFYSGMLNVWIRNIVSMKSDEFYNNYGESAKGVNFTKLRDLFEQLPKFTTEQQVRDFLYNLKFDDTINNFIKANNPFASQKENGWVYIASRYMNGDEDSRFAIQHRLYIGIDSYYIHRFVNEFISKCLKRNLACEFKFDFAGSRDDNIVIYCSDENLTLFVVLCEEIKKENPEMEGYFRKPPILTGVYNGWIGYGAEPVKEEGSYTSIRASAIEKVLYDEVYQFFSAIQDTPLSINGVEYRIQEYLAYTLYVSRLKLMRQLYEWYLSKGHDVSKFNIDLLSDKTYLTNLRRTINEFVNKYYYDLWTPGFSESVSFPGIDGQSITISTGDMKDAARLIFKMSVSKNKAYLERIRTRILNNSPQYEGTKNNYPMNERFANGIEHYRKQKAVGQRVTASRAANNVILYKKCFNLLEQIYSKIKRDDRREIEALFGHLKLFVNGMQKVGIGWGSFSSSDVHERTQFYIHFMGDALRKSNLNEYERLRSLYYNYELEANKKL